MWMVWKISTLSDIKGDADFITGTHELEHGVCSSNSLIII